MIDLYSWGTPNGRKVSIMLEECGLAYRVHPVDITAGQQFSDAFKALTPNGKIPVIHDPDGPDGPITLFESGAILIYLADKTQKFLPPAGAERYQVLQWLMFQMGGIGPIFGQTHHFLRFATESVPYAISRYQNETKRLYGVLDQHLCHHDFLAQNYSIADMATYPWVARAEWQGVNLAQDFPQVYAWTRRLENRAAVTKGMAVPG